MLVWRYFNSKYRCARKRPDGALSLAVKPFIDALTYCRRNALRSKAKEDEKRRAGETEHKESEKSQGPFQSQPDSHQVQMCWMAETVTKNVALVSQ